jgi:hypothetical protein
MHTTHFIAALCLPVLFGSLPHAGDDLAFKPEAGSQVTKTYAHKLELSLQEMHFKFGDQDIPADQMPELKVDIVDEQKLAFSDTYVSLAGGRPKVLERKFDALGSSGVEKASSEDGDEEHTSERESKLEGKTVVFTRADEGGECEVAFKKDSTGDKALLADLVEDTDLRAFLPTKAVADGDSWDIDGKLFNALFSPGGDLHLEAKSGEEDHSIDRAELRANMEGKAKATYKGERDEKGTKVAVIELAFEVQSKCDTDEDVGEGVKQHSDYAVELKLEGELLWNRKLGRAHALDVHGDAKIKLAQTTHVDADEGGGDWIQTMLFGGSASFTANFEGAQ